MKASVKEIFSHSVIYGAGLVINKILSFLLVPLYTFYFSPSEMGMFNIAQSVWLFIIIIYLFGTETSFIKYFIERKDTEERKNIYSTSLILMSVSSAIFSLLIYLLSGSISGLINFEDRESGAYLIKVLSLVLFTDTLFRFPLLLLRAELKAFRYFLLSLTSLIVNLSFNIIFIVFLGAGVEAIFYSYAISCIVTFIAGIIITKKYLKMTFSGRIAKELLKYGNIFFYVGLLTLVIDVSDRFFLKYYFSESTVGIYNASYRLASVMALAITSFRFAWTPYFLNLKDNPENKKIISEIFTYLIAAGMIFFLFFYFFTEPIVKINFGSFSLLDQRYQSGLIIIPFILLAYLFSGIYSALNAAPFLADRTSGILLVTFAGFICNVLLNLLLIPVLEITGAALSTMITYLLMLIMIYFLSQKVYRIEYDWYKLAVIITSAVITVIIQFIIQSIINQPTTLIISEIILFILYLLFLVKFRAVKLITVKSIFTKNT